jgi:Uma2 family endonuclease
MPAESLADLLAQLGNIPPARVRSRPAPGTATEQDVIAIRDREKRHYELVDGVLVEKVMGIQESLLALWIGHLFWTFLEQHDLGVAVGEAGALRLMRGLVRTPDVSFISWDRLPGGELPPDPIPDLAPDLAVEVLSKGNTRPEIKRKLREYFLAGVRLVWIINPRTRTAEAYTSPSKKRRIGKTQALDGGDVLPGFSLPLPELFARGRRQRGRP